MTHLEVGYHLTPAFQGKGYATEAAAACVTWAKVLLGASEVVAIIHPSNHASRLVAERLGMTVERTTMKGDTSVVLYRC